MAKMFSSTSRQMGRVSKDIKTFVKRSDRALKKMVDKELKDALVEVSKTMVKDIRSGSASNVHTGTLRRSIGRKLLKKSRKSPLARRVAIGPRIGEKWKGYHGHLVEAGTKQRTTKSGSNRGAVEASPYMAPAFEKNKGMIERRIRDVVNRFPRKLKV